MHSRSSSTSSNPTRQSAPAAAAAELQSMTLVRQVLTFAAVAFHLVADPVARLVSKRLDHVLLGCEVLAVLVVALDAGPAAAAPTVGGAVRALLGAGLWLTGAALVGASVVSLGPRRFLSFAEAGPLVTDGAYALCRHPFAAGLVALALGGSVLGRAPSPLARGGGATALLLLLVEVSIEREEAALRGACTGQPDGAGLWGYLAATPRLVPRPRPLLAAAQAVLSRSCGSFIVAACERLRASGCSFAALARLDELVQRARGGAQAEERVML